MHLLETVGLTKMFGGLAAVVDLDIAMDPGRIVGLIGPNGAGKSTVLNMLGGTYRPSKGRIIFGGQEIARLPVHQRAALGIARVFQENILFSEFTALENIMVGFHLQKRMSPARIFKIQASRTGYDPKFLDRGRVMLEQIGLAEEVDAPAGDLPHGKQRILSLAIARATGPRLFLLDEPLTGLNAEEVASMVALIKRMRREDGITCLVVEHNVRAVMGLCDEIFVLCFGRKIASGKPEEVANHPQVIEAYLGTDEALNWAGQLDA